MTEKREATILVVDDNPKNLQLLGKLLSEHDYQVGFARNGEQALKAVQAKLPDLLLLDVNMPIMDGMETCKRLKESPYSENIPIIFLTANTDSDGMIEGLKLGAVDYVTKPFVTSELLARVNTHLQLKFSREIIAERTIELEDSISNLKKTQDQLVVQGKMASLGTLTAGIAHELKNPLNIINNFASVCSNLIQDLKIELEKQGVAEGEDMEELINSLDTVAMAINKQGQKADDIIKTMLWHTKTTGGNNERVDVNKLFKGYSELTYHSLLAKDPEFHLDLKLCMDESLPPIKVPQSEVGRVFLNILDNAFYSTYNKAQETKEAYEPEIKVSTQNFESHLEFRVWDNGCGISPDNIEKVFIPFFTTKPPGEGIGLGLSLSYDVFVTNLGGTMDIESEEGEYTEFILRLPKSNLEMS